MWPWESPSRIGVSITAGAMQLTRTPVPATSLPIDFVIAITAAFSPSRRPRSGCPPCPRSTRRGRSGRSRARSSPGAPPGTEERPVRVDREDAPPLLVRHLDRVQRPAGHPGGADEDVDPAEALSTCARRLDVRRRRDVARDRDAPLPGPAVEACDLGAARAQPLGRCGPIPLAPPVTRATRPEKS